LDGWTVRTRRQGELTITLAREASFHARVERRELGSDRRQPLGRCKRRQVFEERTKPAHDVELAFARQANLVGCQAEVLRPRDARQDETHAPVDLVDGRRELSHDKASEEVVEAVERLDRGGGIVGSR
jgi:hypothetical protein